MNEFLEQFLVEARELVEQATNDLLALEAAPSDRESLDGAFRVFHTLKGGAGIVDFAAMSRAMHAAEDVLATVRAGGRPVDAALIGDCLTAIDNVVQWLDTIQDTGALPQNADAAADRLVARLVAGETAARDAKPEVAETSTPPAASPLAILEAQIGFLGAGGDGRIGAAGRLAANLLRHLNRTDDADEIARVTGESLKSGRAATLIDAITQVLQASTEAAPLRSEPLSRTLRVDAERVNALVNLTGELTVAKNAIGHIARLARESDSSLAAAIQDEHARLERLIATLQRAVLGLRVLPLRTVFQRFSRPVREMSESLAKPVRLETEGEDTEADKAIVDILFEPLLHVVRNAMDHGIEPAAEREAAGKSLIAAIHLRACREGEHVVIEVEDDGRGIDADRVRAAAAERRLVAPDALAAMSDAEAVELIFAPGFSTARAVTGLSGRGVGMDAVRTAVERVGGGVQLRTDPGSGSIVRFVLPFSVMMTRVMTVQAGGQMFGIPLDAVVETVRIPRGQVHPVGGAHAFVLRDRTVPLVDLGRTLGRGGGGAPAAEATVVVTLSGGQLGGLEVDRLGERMDVMLKAPDGLLAGLPGIAGTTMLGDGSVLLILDLSGVLQ
ncbi:MAG TPA: chemotaxis protein CheA [Rhizomicrobium sp.]|jgi:two-component system chemotaxis sensor kinase CheA|nr:chemotaxis protein CheA [Rhizomicrobium sp.]